MRAKKRLGQSFLKSKIIVKDILAAGNIVGGDTILEIGPGEGILTEGLLARAKRVVAMEKDSDLIPFLREKFAEEIKRGALELVNADILCFKPEDYGLKTKKYKLIANIPYYITGKLLRAFLDSVAQPALVVFMVQKEVAERVVARDKKESILSVSVKIFGSPRIIKKVPAEYFKPKPKVDSAILLIDSIHSPFGSHKKKEHFFNILRKGFSHKRKLLKSNLECDVSVLSICGVGEQARPENIETRQWVCIANEIERAHKIQ